MKKIVCFLLAVSLMLSLSVFSFATPELTSWPTEEYLDNIVIPYALVPTSNGISVLASRNESAGTWTQLIENSSGIYEGQGTISYIGADTSYNRTFYVQANTPISNQSPNYWWNFIGRITDANGYILQASDFNKFALYQVSSAGNFLGSMGFTDPATDNIYQFEDGYIQIAISSTRFDYANAGQALACNISNSSVVAPLSFEVEVMEAYQGESSTTVYPFTFGSGAHNVVPPAPEIKDPNDHTQYGSASDQVEWYNDAYGSAVNPELEDKMSATTDMLLQEQEIEEQMISGIQQYAPSVDPVNLTMPTQIVNGLSFIGNTFMGSYNALGDIGFVISFSMMLGVVLVLIGRGEGALARGMASSARERRRTEYASDRDMKKGG